MISTRLYRLYALAILMVSPLLMAQSLAGGSSATVDYYRIIGGSLSTVTPTWMVSIQHQGFTHSHFCGGSYLGGGWVVTAAHCVDGLTAQQLWVSIGQQDLAKSLTYYSVERIVMHSDYDAQRLSDDIALIRLTSVNDLQPVALPEADFTLTQGELLTAYGYGVTAENGSLSDQLQQVDLPYIAATLCQDNYGDDITTGMLCAGYAEGGQDSCQGDSGGPLVSQDGYLVGITSWGYGCARPGYPGVYTQVTQYVQWINTQRQGEPTVLATGPQTVSTTATTVHSSIPANSGSSAAAQTRSQGSLDLQWLMITLLLASLRVGYRRL